MQILQPRKETEVCKILHGEVGGKELGPNSSTVSHKPGAWNEISWQRL